MIRTTDKPKHRFNIERNLARFNQKQANNATSNSAVQHNGGVVFSSNYSQEIDDANQKIQTLQSEYDSTLKEHPELTDKLNEISSKLMGVKAYLEELQKLQKKSLNATSVKIQNVKYSARTIRMGPFYKISKLWEKYLLIAILGCISSVVVWLLVQYTGVYSAGLSGVIQGLAKIVKIELDNAQMQDLAVTVYNAMFWGMYFVLNIPLLIFAYFKLGKHFALMTIVYIAFSQLVGFGLGYINDGQGIFIFANMSQIENTPLFVPGVQLLPWNSGNGAIPSLFVYAAIYALVAGISNSIVYILGASTGGTDVFGFYFSKVKNKSIGTLLTYFNVGSLIIGVILGSFTCWMIQAKPDQQTPNSILEAFFSPNLIASVLGSILSGMIYNYFFPRSKIVKVQIYSEKAQEIAFSLIEKDWNYKLIVSQNTSDSLGGSSANKSLETVCSYIDLPVLVSNIRDVDSDGLITIYSTFGVDGELPTTSYER